MPAARLFIIEILMLFAQVVHYYLKKVSRCKGKAGEKGGSSVRH